MGWIGLGVLTGLLWLPELKMLWVSWQGDASLSHGPLIPVIALVLLWVQRSKIRYSSAASRSGLIFLLLTLPLYIGAVCADIDFLKVLCLIAMLCGGFWFLGGWKTLQAAAGALGFLVFMIPWPMSLIETLSFPLQLLSSTYAALFAGIWGLPVQREGVYLCVRPDPMAKPIYGIVVAHQCSGMTSLLVLLALGYLIAYHSPLKWGWRVLIVGAVVPLTLLMNALRLTVILLAGAYHSPALAAWIHDHEGPVLIFCCSLGLLGLRHALLQWTQLPPTTEGETLASTQTAHSERGLAASASG